MTDVTVLTDGGTVPEIYLERDHKHFRVHLYQRLKERSLPVK